MDEVNRFIYKQNKAVGKCHLEAMGFFLFSFVLVYILHVNHFCHLKKLCIFNVSL